MFWAEITCSSTRTTSSFRPSPRNRRTNRASMTVWPSSASSPRSTRAVRMGSGSPSSRTERSARLSPTSDSSRRWWRREELAVRGSVLGQFQFHKFDSGTIVGLSVTRSVSKYPQRLSAPLAATARATRDSLRVWSGRRVTTPIDTTCPTVADMWNFLYNHQS